MLHINKYKVIRFIMQNIILPGHPDYSHCRPSNGFTPKIFEISCGKFTIKYNYYVIPFGYYSEEHKEKWYTIMREDNPLYTYPDIIQMEIYENNKLINTKSTKYTPCINIYGDGLTPENTYYTFLEDMEIKTEDKPKIVPRFNIYNMKNELVKSFDFCRWSLVIDIKIIKYNDKYYVICMDGNLLSISKLDLNYESIGKCESVGKWDDNYIILPTLGQNKMYVIQITDNNIVFNTGQICKIDNINYVLSKFILIENPLYRKKLLNNYYVKNKYMPNKTEMKHFVITHGNFSAEYDYPDHRGRFDSNIGKFAQSTKVIFKECGEIIFEMTSVPSVVIHGDGVTREGTKFCIGCVSIYDMNQKLIRHTQIGSDSHHDIQRVNDKYAISTSIEVCNWTPFFGLIDLDLFFSQTGDEEQVKPYDNARTYIPVRQRDDVLYATCADENGFILNNGYILPYEEAEDFDFSNGNGYYTLDFSKLGYNEEQIKQMNDVILHGGTISIPVNQDN